MTTLPKNFFGRTSNKGKSPDWMNGFISRLWLNINRHTVNGKYAKETPKNRSYFARGIRVECSKEEFSSWCRRRRSRIKDLFLAGSRPSVDRIDNDKHYSLDNLRIIDFRENCAQGAFYRAKRLDEEVMRLPKRQCLRCNKVLSRHPKKNNIARESIVDFGNRRYCGKSCAISHRRRGYTKYNEKTL